MINKTKLIFLPSIDYPNNLNSFSQLDENLFFDYKFYQDNYLPNLFNEVQNDNFTREEFDINYLLRNAAISQFKFFFKSLNTDTPEILNKTKSLKRLKGLTPLTRLSLHLARSGKKLKATKLILLSFSRLILKLKQQAYVTNYDWRSLMVLLNTTYTNPKFFKGFLKIQNFFISDQYKLKRNTLQKLNELTINEILFQNFKKFNYLFSFYIYKVDKQIYKNSRGKSGKYTFVWKYVAPYKRNFLILHWLTKEIRIAPGKTLQDRVDYVIHNFISNTHNTWIWKIKKFSLNYVYYNLRKTLGETYKTSMR